MKKVALVSNVAKKNARSAGMRIISLLGDRGVEVVASGETAALFEGSVTAAEPRDVRREASLVITLGGDGTVLKAAHSFAGSGVPLLGLNLGGLGFLTAATVDEAEKVVTEALEGRCRADERMLLDVTLARGGKTLSGYRALNDAVITKGLLSRLVRLDAFVGDEYLTTFVSDGLIVSSPTGSTAHSLSAGGPLVSPDTDAIIVTPICPHTLTNRPLIVPAGKSVRVVVADEARDVALTLDGQIQEKLEHRDEMRVEASETRLTLIFPPGDNYFHLLREKLNWGGSAAHAKGNA